MNYSTLTAELQSDPTGVGYAGMTDAEAAAAMNAATRTRLAATIDSAALYEAIVPAEFGALSADEKQLVRDLFTLGTVHVRDGSNGRAVLLATFGAQSGTIAALIEAATERISRAAELGLPPVDAAHVQSARATPS